MSFLERWNAMTEAAAAEAVLPCCGSRTWADRLAARRPLNTLPELLAASDASWWSLTPADWQQSFDSHPRIGQRHAVSTAQSLQWSGGEQSAAMNSDDTAKAALAEGNLRYEAKFGRIFIVCASGRSAPEMLAILERRMHNTSEDELHEAAEQQRQITHLRLQKWLMEKEEG